MLRSSMEPDSFPGWTGWAGSGTVGVRSRISKIRCALAAARCGGRIVSLLEGGYDLEALAASVETHVGELMT